MQANPTSIWDLSDKNLNNYSFEGSVQLLAEIRAHNTLEVKKNEARLDLLWARRKEAKTLVASLETWLKQLETWLSKTVNHYLDALIEEGKRQRQSKDKQNCDLQSQLRPRELEVATFWTESLESKAKLKADL